MIKLNLLGATGRMGREIILEVKAQSSVFSLNNAPLSKKNMDWQCYFNGDVILDFSSPEGTKKLIEEALKSASYQTLPAFLIGTTGLSDEIHDEINKLSSYTAVLIASNTSLGIAVLEEIMLIASKKLGKIYDIEIHEIHHNKKVDAPSGTALSLAKKLANERNAQLLFGREAYVGPRSDHEIGIHALRGGGVFGEHHIHFLGEHETLTLTHKALSRKAFAQGALHFAKWLTTQKPGLYSIKDALSI